MYRAARAALFSGLMIPLFATAAQGASVGSLAPHDVATNGSDQQQQQWIADPRTGCRALDSDFDPDDSIAWSGGCSAGLAWGRGALSFVNKGHVLETVTGTFASGVLQPGHVTAFWADGSRYDGNQLGGEFDGVGVFSSTTGDKLDGQWKAGALNGHATVTWANGDRYDGEWKNGKSDGRGTEVWADGRRFEGMWIDGKPAGNDTPASSVPAPPLPSTPPPLIQAAGSVSAPGNSANNGNVTAASESTAIPSDASATPLRAFIGTRLLSVDGSTIELSPAEDGFGRIVTMPTGATQQISFTFMNPRIGTVSTDSTVIGLFRTGQHELDIDFADGTVEVMKPDAANGLIITTRAPDGQSSCTAWYPQGHAFAEAEKRAAVQEYAARLGVAVSASLKKKVRTIHAESRSCGGAFLETVPMIGTAAAADTTDSIPGRAPVALSPSSTPLEQPQQVPLARHELRSLQNVAVRPSNVQPIDAPDMASTPQPMLQAAAFAVNAATTMHPVKASESGPTNTHDDLNASQCLSVASNGQYWGFQNSCGKTVQFAYCEMSEANPLTSCHRTSVVGSVAGNGFSSLVTDKSLAEQGATHEFRWMACDGGAGEVVPHLDSVDPPSGRCLRTVASTE